MVSLQYSIQLDPNKHNVEDIFMMSILDILKHRIQSKTNAKKWLVLIEIKQKSKIKKNKIKVRYIR